MAEYTGNLNLAKRLADENYSREQNNENLDKIDAFAGEIKAEVEEIKSTAGSGGWVCGTKTVKVSSSAQVGVKYVELTADDLGFEPDENTIVLFTVGHAEEPYQGMVSTYISYVNIAIHKLWLCFSVGDMDDILPSGTYYVHYMVKIPDSTETEEATE